MQWRMTIVIVVMAVIMVVAITGFTLIGAVSARNNFIPIMK